MTVTRRALLQTTAATAAVTALPAARAGAAPSEDASRLLDKTTDRILTAYPESASSAGIDSGKYAPLKWKLTDRSPEGQAKIESDARDTLAKLKKIDTSALPADEALNVEVVRTVYDTTVEGFDLPYGDIALLNSNWSYRNAPYAVAQNTGAFVEIPSFLDSSHQIETSDDADAYLSRMKAYADQLDGETERVKASGELGVILPDFLMAKTLGQLRTARARPAADWSLVNSLVNRTADMPTYYSGPALAIA